MVAAKGLLTQLCAVLDCDLPTLTRIDDYIHGDHDDPYMPDNANAEYRLLASRSRTNLMPLLVATPAQTLFVDGFRPSRVPDLDSPTGNPEWAHWQRSRMDSRQTAIHRGALTYGHSFAVTERDSRDQVITRGLSALRTAALYEDPGNDIAPYAAATVTRWAPDPYSRDEGEPGTGILWDAKNRYDFEFTSLTDPESFRIGRPEPHGADECPVTRFAAAVDLDGRTVGVVEPMIPLQNRINQTVFDLLVAQTYGSFKVRWISGMAPPVKRNPETGAVILDANGNPEPLPISVNASRFMFGENADVKFGTLDHTPLDGYIDAIDAAIRQWAAISQTPPHHILGQIANVSADGLQAAESALSRKNQEFRVVFGESWERVFRLAGALEGDGAAAGDEAGEVIWRDVGARSLAQVADAWGKLRESLNIPARALWEKIPGVTQTELAQWDEYAQRENADLQTAESLFLLNQSLADDEDPGALSA